MRILYIAAGAGDMFCGLCARDGILVNELLSIGEDVQFLPLYTPVRTDGYEFSHDAPVYFGGINVYLQQMSAFWRMVPPALDRVLDNRRLLKWASRFAVSTDSRILGPMTVSMLSGKLGRQRKELERLLAHVGRHRPEHIPLPPPFRRGLGRGVQVDVVNLTTSLLSGLAPEMKSRLGVPVVCNVQGEDSFLDTMPEPFASQSRELIAQNSAYIDLFISPSEAYADKMAGYIGISRDRFRVVRSGIDASRFARVAPRPASPFGIGFLSAITANKGIDILVDAFIDLVRGRGREAVLTVAGQIFARPLWQDCLKRIAEAGLDDRFIFLGELEFEEKVRFLQGISVFVQPSRITESRGIAAMEAMASGVPVVVPSTGVFPELVAATGGGITVSPEDPAAIADALEQLIDDPEQADLLGSAASSGIGSRYSARAMAEGVAAVYRELT